MIMNHYIVEALAADHRAELERKAAAHAAAICLTRRRRVLRRFLMALATPRAGRFDSADDRTPWLATRPLDLSNCECPRVAPW